MRRSTDLILTILSTKVLNSSDCADSRCSRDRLRKLVVTSIGVED
jgi:hypothetical protein